MASASVACTGLPTFAPAEVFSATSRVTLERLNTGALLVTTPVTVAVASLVSVSVLPRSSSKLTLTLMVLARSAAPRV